MWLKTLQLNEAKSMKIVTSPETKTSTTSDQKLVKSPLVGVFYSAPSEEARTFCEGRRYCKKRADNRYRRSNETDE